MAGMEERTLKIYKEGLLFKRQRGLHKTNTKRLSFQERFCRISSQSLDYYHPDPRKRVSSVAIKGYGQVLENSKLSQLWAKPLPAARPTITSRRGFCRVYRKFLFVTTSQPGPPTCNTRWKRTCLYDCQKYATCCEVHRIKFKPTLPPIFITSLIVLLVPTVS